MSQTPQKPTRVTSVKTPGAVPERLEITPEQRAEMAAESEALDAQLMAEGADDVVDPVPPVVGAAPDLRAYIDNAIAEGIAKGLATMRRAQAAPAPAAAELPDQATVNPFEIKREVLTKQGYVVPAAYPQTHVPNALR